MTERWIYLHHHSRWFIFVFRNVKVGGRLCRIAAYVFLSEAQTSTSWLRWQKNGWWKHGPKWRRRAAAPDQLQELITAQTWFTLSIVLNNEASRTYEVLVWHHFHFPTLSGSVWHHCTAPIVFLPTSWKLIRGLFFAFKSLCALMSFCLSALILAAQSPPHPGPSDRPPSFFPPPPAPRLQGGPALIPVSNSLLIKFCTSISKVQSFQRISPYWTVFINTWKLGFCSKQLLCWTYTRLMKEALTCDMFSRARAQAWSSSPLLFISTQTPESTADAARSGPTQPARHSGCNRKDFRVNREGRRRPFRPDRSRPVSCYWWREIGQRNPQMSLTGSHKGNNRFGVPDFPFQWKKRKKKLL